MKKFFAIILMVPIMMTLMACSNEKSDLSLLDKEGIAPYELSESDKELLQSYGINNNSQRFSFNAPKEVSSIGIKAFRLNDDSSWETIGGGEISMDDESELGKQKAGTVTMVLKDNYGIDFNIKCNGILSFKTDGIDSANENFISVKSFLTDHKDIQMNKEIPVALMVYDSGTSMESYTLQDYFTPSKFTGMDLVQVVIVTFSDKKINNN